MKSWFARRRERRSSTDRSLRSAVGAVESITDADSGLAADSGVTVRPEPVAPAPLPPADFTRFVGRTDRIVVIDTETTGLEHTARVIEIAVVTLDLSGRVIDEWDTLVNPRGGVGPTHVHGITSDMVAPAPTFGDIAAQLAARLDGAIVCGHNITFDIERLTNEFRRCGIEVEWGTPLCTWEMTRRSLVKACAEFEVELNGHHTALIDARATAELLGIMIDGVDVLATAVRVGSEVPAPVRVEVRRPHAVPRRETLAPFAKILTAAVERIVGWDDHDRAVAAIEAVLAEAEQSGGTPTRFTAERIDEALEVVGVVAAIDAQARRAALLRHLDAATTDARLSAGGYTSSLVTALALGIEQGGVDAASLHARSIALKVRLAPNVAVCIASGVEEFVEITYPGHSVDSLIAGLGLARVSTPYDPDCALVVTTSSLCQSVEAVAARSRALPTATLGALLAIGDGFDVEGEALGVDPARAVWCEACGTATVAAFGKLRRRCHHCEDVAVA